MERLGANPNSLCQHPQREETRVLGGNSRLSVEPSVQESNSRSRSEVKAVWFDDCAPEASRDAYLRRH
jgi:hypothetical protein